MSTTPTASPPGSNETHALAAAMAAPTPFRSRAQDAALAASDRHVERWAPERDATGRTRSLRSLAFADRLIAPYFSLAQDAGAVRMFSAPVHGGFRERGVQPVSWLFPRPWYRDELDWMAAAREPVEGGESGGELTTRGTFAAAMPSGSRTAASGASAPFSPAFSPAFSIAMEFVAPSMAPSLQAGPDAGGFGGGLRPVGRVAAAGDTAMPASSLGLPALKAWNPLVSFAAAQAAEIMAGVGAGAAGGGAGASGGGIAERQVLPAVMDLVAPRDLAAAADAGAAGGREATLARRDAGPSGAASAMPEASRARLTELVRQMEQDRQAAAALAATSASEALASRQRVPAEAASPSSPSETTATRDADGDIATAREAGAEVGFGGGNADRRGADLLARTALAGGATLAPASGPRIALPAGLGGLVAALETSAVVSRPASRTMAFGGGADGRATGAQLAGARFATQVIGGGATDAEYPTLTMPLFAAGASAGGGAAGGGSALGAVTAARPAGLGHVAWADRWLARFAGASAESLNALDAVSAAPSRRERSGLDRTLVASWIAPWGESAGSTLGVDTERGGSELARPVGRTAAVESAPVLRAALRIDDSASVSDEVFAAIAAASRPAPRGAAAARVAAAMGGAAARESAAHAQAEAAAQQAAASAAVATAPRPSMIDGIVGAAPGAPDAGLHAGLAASPMAPALGGAMALPASPTFDTRAAFAPGLAAAYLAGLVTTGPRGGRLGAPVLGASPMNDAAVARFAAPQLAYVAPGGMPSSGPASDDTTGRDESGGGRGAPGFIPASVAALFAPASPRLAPAGGASASPSGSAFEDASPASGSSPGATPFASPFAATASASASVDASVAARAAWSTRPGSTAELAQSFGVAQERSSAGLSFDFVSPELVLAARVYGFGPTEAAQASRLAGGGRAGLAAMASAVDLAFLRALRDADPANLEAELPVARLAAAAAGGGGGAVLSGAPDASAASASAAPNAGQSSMPTMGLGGPARAPRGAFLWPAATVGALGLHAASPESSERMPLAALELLAARAVAEMGYVAGARTGARDGASAGVRSGSIDAAGSLSSADVPSMTSGVAGEGVIGQLDAGAAEGPAQAAQHVGLAPDSALGRQFQAIFLALAASGDPSASPSVRAAQALALAHRVDAPSLTARDRAAAAWSVMPIVYGGAAAAGAAGDGGGGGGEIAAREPLELPLLSGAALSASSDEGADALSADRRPGLRHTAARAGQALSAYVTPQATIPDESASSSSAAMGGAGRREVERGAVLRAPTAAPELVRTGTEGSSSGGDAGGRVELPSWFHDAAQRMFQSAGPSEQISLAELTLVATAPAKAIAASPKGAASAPAPAATGGANQQRQGDEKPDIDKLAQDVYAEVCRLIEIARERSGDPWQ